MAAPKERNYVSSLGFAIGYVGGGIILISMPIIWIVNLTLLIIND